jgi:dephospho-CoA kinase
VLRVGLTGGVACGKSVIGEMFAKHGIKVIQADLVAHQLMQPGEPVYQEVVAHFGREVLNPDGTVNRPKLAEAAFGGGTRTSRIQELNRIVHPAVLSRQDAWMDEIGRANENAVAMVEAALILEAGARERFDKMVVVTCRPEQRVERLAKRMKIGLESARREVDRRMAAQLSDDEKIKTADYVIDNSGSLDTTEKQVATVAAELLRLAKES